MNVMMAMTPQWVGLSDCERCRECAMVVSHLEVSIDCDGRHHGGDDDKDDHRREQSRINRESSLDIPTEAIVCWTLQPELAV